MKHRARRTAGKYDDIDFSIPESVANNAKRGLELREEHGGGTDVGMNTARALSSGGTVSPEKARHISQYFPRHEGDNLDDKTSKGWVAWQLWGGHAARSWSEKIVGQMDKADEGGSGDSGNSSESKESRMTTRVSGRIAGRVALAFGTSHERGEEIARIVAAALRKRAGVYQVGEMLRDRENGEEYYVSRAVPRTRNDGVSTIVYLLENPDDPDDELVLDEDEIVGEFDLVTSADDELEILFRNSRKR